MRYPRLALSCLTLLVILSAEASSTVAPSPANNSLEFGVNLGSTPPELLDRLLDEARQLGASWIRVDLSWESVETQRGHRDYSYIEMLVSKAKSRELRVLLLLTDPPDWALRPSFNLNAWRDFVRETIERLGGLVSAWQIMNEPDSPEVNPIPPQLYVDILSAAYGAIKEVRNADQVVTAGLTPVGIRYLEELYRLGGSEYFDVLGLNPYGPSPAASASVVSTFMGLMRNLGLEGKPVWITEVGWPVVGEGLTGALKGVGESGQAENLAAVFCLLSSLEGVEKIFWFKLMDGPTGLEETPHWGLIATLERRRPAYHVYREAVSWLTQPSHAVELSATPNSTWVGGSVEFSLLTDPPTEAIRWRVFAKSSVDLGLLQVGSVAHGERLSWRPDLPGVHTIYAAWEQGCVASESNKIEILVQPVAVERSPYFLDKAVAVALTVSAAASLLWVIQARQRRRAK